MGRLFSESHSITVMTWSRHVQNTYLYWVYSFPACYGLLSGCLHLISPVGIRGDYSPEENPGISSLTEPHRQSPPMSIPSLLYVCLTLFCSAFFVTVRAGTAYRKIGQLVNNFFCSHNKVHCSEIPILLSNLLYHYFFHWIMAHFNFVINQNAK